MLKSMTGYGNVRCALENMELSIEMKSVNHRFFECSIRIPRAFTCLEELIKSDIQKDIHRGKVDISVDIKLNGEQDDFVKINKQKAAQYVSQLRELAGSLNLKDDLAISHIAKFNDVFEIEKKEVDQNLLYNTIKPHLLDAVQKLVQMRIAEGNALKLDILNRIKTISNYVELINQDMPNIISEYKNKLTNKIRDIIGNNNLDENRLLTEVAIFSEKIAVSEEIVRLASHFDQMKEYLEKDEPVGRKLDFLVQEINREINTVGSKVNAVSVTKLVVEVKSEIEKIREQIQNIE